jgi:tripartite-type tricarboxylate transporter receptor subunit TctC
MSAMKLPRSIVLAPVALIFAAQPGPMAQAQDYPVRPVTLIVPWAAGGAQDVLGRMLAPKLADRLGKAVSVENRPGAASVIGMAAAARAAPDGYTLVQAGAAFAINAAVYKKLPYHSENDFAPVALVAQVPFLLVINPSLPVYSVADLIALARDKPGQLSYASAGPGSPHHLAAELLKSMTGIELIHVPYKGSAPAVADVVAGHVPIHFSDPVAALPLIKAGKLRALGVSTAARLPSAPDIATIAETGVVGFDVGSWIMIVAPAKTPKAIVAKLHTELTSIAQLPDIQQRLIDLGMIPVRSDSPEALQRFIDSEITRWANVVGQAGIAGSE